MRWAARTLGVAGRTTMPGLIGMQQEATSDRAPSTSTTHTRHAPTFVVPS